MGTAEMISYSSVCCPHDLTKICSEHRGILKECEGCQWNIKYEIITGRWQTCPKCFGQGFVWFPINTPHNETFVTNGNPYKCDVCNGKKIIDITTGKPPTD